MRHYGSELVHKSLFASLWILMGLYGSKVIFVCPYESSLVLMRFYASFMGLNVSL